VRPSPNPSTTKKKEEEEEEEEGVEGEGKGGEGRGRMTIHQYSQQRVHWNQKNGVSRWFGIHLVPKCFICYSKSIFSQSNCLK
jgi:hypothetical protein